MNVEYIKDYKYKELKQYVLAYLLITVASVGLYAKNTMRIREKNCRIHIGSGSTGGTKQNPRFILLTGTSCFAGISAS